MNQNRSAQTIPTLASAPETLLVGEMAQVAISLFTLEKRIACLSTAMVQVRQLELLKEVTGHRKSTKHHLEISAVRLTFTNIGLFLALLLF